MEFLYPQVINILISIGDIDTLAALWKELSYVPSLFYLKDLINSSTKEIANILSIKIPGLEIFSQTAMSNIPFVDLGLDIYGKISQVNTENMDLRIETNSFVKLVNYYDSLVITDLLTKKDIDTVNNFLSNNRRRSTRFLEVYLRIYSFMEYYISPAIRGTLFYWMLIDNKQLMDKKLPITNFLSLINTEWVFICSLYNQAEREDNYYPLFAIKKHDIKNIPIKFLKLYVSSSPDKQEITRFIVELDYGVIYYERIINPHEIIDLYLKRKDTSDKDKRKLATKLVEENCLVLNISDIEYDRTFHNHYILKGIKSCKTNKNIKKEYSFYN